MKQFIDEHRAVHRVEPICRVLPISPSTYHAHAARLADPALRCARAKTDEALMPEVQRVWDENFKVYGVRKVWRQLRHEPFDVARCTVQRLMKRQDLRGVIRGKPVRTTVAMRCRGRRGGPLRRNWRPRPRAKGRRDRRVPERDRRGHDARRKGPMPLRSGAKEAGWPAPPAGGEGRSSRQPNHRHWSCRP